MVDKPGFKADHYKNNSLTGFGRHILKVYMYIRRTTDNNIDNNQPYRKETRPSLGFEPRSVLASGEPAFIDVTTRKVAKTLGTRLKVNQGQ